MKLNDIRESYGFNQRTFYNWMKEQRLIEKTENGYIAGKEALDGMATEETSYFGPDGKPKTVVIVTEENADELAKLYVNSGLDRLYSTIKRKEKHPRMDSLLNEELERTKARMDILENQMGTLAVQVNVLAETLSK